MANIQSRQRKERYRNTAKSSVRKKSERLVENNYIQIKSDGEMHSLRKIQLG